MLKDGWQGPARTYTGLVCELSSLRRPHSDNASRRCLLADAHIYEYHLDGTDEGYFILFPLWRYSWSSFFLDYCYGVVYRNDSSIDDIVDQQNHDVCIRFLSHHTWQVFVRSAS